MAYQAENSVFLEELREDGRRTKRSVIEFPIDVVVSLASRIGLRPTAPAPVVPITGVMPIIKSGIA
ncbi:hypothetical protein [Pseudolysinimonas sp.]|uniref:hypothetical protein n=1 Tax=Pseudolysinimonas sp. TaxID=2680009 RepID=UPI003F7EB48A